MVRELALTLAVSGAFISPLAGEGSEQWFARYVWGEDVELPVD